VIRECLRSLFNGFSDDRDDLAVAKKKAEDELHNLRRDMANMQTAHDDANDRLHALLTEAGVPSGPLFTRTHTLIGEYRRLDAECTHLAAECERQRLLKEHHNAEATALERMHHNAVEERDSLRAVVDTKSRAAVPEDRRLVILQAISEWHGAPDAASIAEMIPTATLSRLKVTGATMERHVAALYGEGYLTRTFVNRRAHYALSLTGREWLASVTDARRSA
jgi:hypothetical protein